MEWFSQLEYRTTGARTMLQMDRPSKGSTVMGCSHGLHLIPEYSHLLAIVINLMIFS